MKKYGDVLIIMALLCAVLLLSTFSPDNSADPVSAEPIHQDAKKLSESIVIQNFVVQTLQAVPVATDPAVPTAVPTQAAVSTSASSPVQWRPTSTPDRAVEIVPTDPSVSPPEYACNVTLNSPYYYQQFSFGEDFDLDVTFTNTGTREWGTDVDVMQYTGMRLEIENKYLYDIDKDYDSAVIVYPGQSIRWKIRMEAPKEQYHDDNKYFATYNLIRGRSAALASGQRDEDESGMFCPFSFYIYVPPQ